MTANDQTQTHHVLTEGTMVDRYRIIERIGVGGMGEVYRAEDTQLDRHVALKFLASHLLTDPEVVDRFEREAKAAARLNHPNIVTVHEVGRYEKRPYIAMELIEGCRPGAGDQGSPMAIKKVLDLALQICDGMSKAHENGIIHRDIKTDNIVVDADGRPKILDFGLATIRGKEEHSHANSTIGTAAYMSPEQVRGGENDARSDLFSFGVVLYELLTGRSPFKRDSEAATLQAIISDIPEPLVRFNPSIPDELQRIVTKLLQKDPALRYQTAADVIADLRSLSITGWVPTVKKSSRRISIWKVAVPAFLILLFGIFGFRTWWNPVSESPTKIPMLVVLPFENLGPPEEDYFAGGITDEITSRLVGIEGLGVISRTSAMRYKNSGKSIREIGRELGVDYILEGTVRWSHQGVDQEVRITPQLIRVSDDRHLWADNYQRRLTEIFEVQSEIAASIVNALDVRLMESKRKRFQTALTENMAAYDMYLKGNYYLNRGGHKSDIMAAIESYESAVELDPGFAVAYARLSLAYNLFWWHSDGGVAAIKRSKEAIDRAQEIDPDLPEAYLSLGSYYGLWERDYEKALELFDRAEDGLVNHSDLYAQRAIVLARMARWDESLRSAKRAVELDPLSSGNYQFLAQYYTFQRNFRESERFIDHAIELSPVLPNPWAFKIVTILSWRGDLDEARRVLDSAKKHVDPFEVLHIGSDVNPEFLGLWRFRLLDDDPNTLLERLDVLAGQIDPIDRFSAMAQLCEQDDKPEMARAYYDSCRIELERQLREVEDISDQDEAWFLSNLGMAYLGLGRYDEAIDSGERALELFSINACHL